MCVPEYIALLSALLIECFSEYDFFNFNTIGGSGNVSANVLVSPTLNSMGPDRPIKIAVQMDGQSPQTVAFIPPAPPGKLPPQWDGNDGFVANSIVSVMSHWSAPPGAHTLKVSKSNSQKALMAESLLPSVVDG